MAIERYPQRNYYAQFDNTVENWSTTANYRATELARTADGQIWEAVRDNINVMPSSSATQDWKEFSFDGLGYNQYINLQNIIDNFMFAYVDDDTDLKNTKRTKVEFFAQQAIQEFTYDIFEVKKVEYELIRGLTMPMPQDLAKVAQISFIDEYGTERLLQRRLESSNPLSPTQDSLTGDLLFGSDGDLLYSAQGGDFSDRGTPESVSQQRYNNNITGAAGLNTGRSSSAGGSFGYYSSSFHLGRRYWAQPELANANGTYTINKKAGTISFDSSLAGEVISIRYVSDGLDSDLTKVLVPKLAEKAVMQTIYSEILEKSGGRVSSIQTAERKRRALTRQAKLRLQENSHSQLLQTLRGKTKWIKT